METISRVSSNGDNAIEREIMLNFSNLFTKKRKRDALKELHKRILADSLLIKSPKNADEIHDFEKRPFKHSTFILYPITLNKNTKHTQYIHAALSEDHKVTTPLSWETIEFLKENLSVDLETVHQIGFEQYNNGHSKLPFHRCYSTATIVWDGSN